MVVGLALLVIGRCREVLELPFLHPAWVFVEFLVVFPIALVS